MNVHSTGHFLRLPHLHVLHVFNIMLHDGCVRHRESKCQQEQDLFIFGLHEVLCINYLKLNAGTEPGTWKGKFSVNMCEIIFLFVLFWHTHFQ